MRLQTGILDIGLNVFEFSCWQVPINYRRTFKRLQILSRVFNNQIIWQCAKFRDTFNVEQIQNLDIFSREWIFHDSLLCRGIWESIIEIIQSRNYDNVLWYIVCCSRLCNSIHLFKDKFLSYELFTRCRENNICRKNMNFCDYAGLHVFCLVMIENWNKRCVHNCLLSWFVPHTRKCTLFIIM